MFESAHTGPKVEGRCWVCASGKGFLKVLVVFEEGVQVVLVVTGDLWKIRIKGG